MWSKSEDFQLKTLSRIDMHLWPSDQLDLVFEEWGLHTRCTQDNEYTLIDLALTQSDSQIITWYRGNPSQGDIWWTLSCRWSTDQPIGSLVWHQSRVRWGRERRIHGSHRPGIYSLVKGLLCWWTPLHLLKGQQLALVDLLEPICIPESPIYVLLSKCYYYPGLGIKGNHHQLTVNLLSPDAWNKMSAWLTTPPIVGFFLLRR